MNPESVRWVRPEDRGIAKPIPAKVQEILGRLRPVNKKVTPEKR
jgi:hypothetical protein